MTQVQQAEETSVKAKVTKTKAKNTEKVTGKTAKVAKVAKVAKAKKASKATGRKLDQFGFVAGKKRSKVAEMYAREDGASTSEVKRKHGHAHLNMMGSLEERIAKDNKKFPFVIDKSKKENKAGRVVTVYKIIGTSKKKAA